jgi:hypothetical protein
MDNRKLSCFWTKINTQILLVKGKARSRKKALHLSLQKGFWGGLPWHGQEKRLTKMGLWTINYGSFTVQSFWAAVCLHRLHIKSRTDKQKPFGAPCAFIANIKKGEFNHVSKAYSGNGNPRADS